jgi:anaerobic dimethyl sulfoxide reductase subunit B (iron-sulfur subunit)
MTQKGFFYDMTTCSGCKTCQIACKDKNNLEVGVNFRKVHYFEGGKYPAPWSYPLSMSCNHCAQPKCVANCPTGALVKRPEDGIVIHHKEKCIGCRLCTWSCPYNAPQYRKQAGKVGKCDFCVDLLDKGEEPACVSACLMRALQFGDIEELKKKYGGTADVRGLPNSTTTSPSISIKPSTHAKL